jgi:F-type H+-transporting ATPase subunit epsilon
VQIRTEVEKVSAEAQNGHFTLLPRHVDFVAALVPGIFYYQTPDGRAFYGLDEGIIVKQGDSVFVSAARAVPGDDLEHLEELSKTNLKCLAKVKRKRVPLWPALKPIPCAVLAAWEENADDSF